MPRNPVARLLDEVGQALTVRVLGLHDERYVEGLAGLEDEVRELRSKPAA